MVISEDPTITIAILTYRRPTLLKRAIKSASAQTYKKIEIAIYDNHSGDETEKVVDGCAQQDPRITYHCHPENIGMLENYQFAINRVTTPFFSLLSDDDLLLPWYCETALEGFRAYPGSLFSAASTIIMREDGSPVRIPLELWKREGYFTPPEGLLEMILQYPVPTSILFKREVRDLIAIDTTNTLGWDVDYLVQIALRFPFYITKKPCAIFLHHSSSFSNAQEMENWLTVYTKIVERVGSSSALTYPAREQALFKIKKDLKNVSAAYLIHYLVHKRQQDAKRAWARFKQERSCFVVKAMMWTLLSLCSICPPAYRIALALRMGKRILKKAIQKLLFFCKAMLTQKQKSPVDYRYYAKWLQKSE